MFYCDFYSQLENIEIFKPQLYEIPLFDPPNDKFHFNLSHQI